MLTDGRRAPWIVAALLALAAGAGATLFAALRHGGPSEPPELLRGENFHDFGIVEIPGGEKVTLHHTFQLANVSGRAIKVSDIVTSCGCTTATSNLTSIGPGETVEIDANFTVNRNGPRSEWVSLRFAEGGNYRMTLTVTGRRLHQLVAAPRLLTVGTADPVLTALAVTDHKSDDEPSPPVFEIPPGFAVQFNGWEREAELNPTTGQPARWIGIIEIRIESEEEAKPALLKIEVDGKSTASVTLMTPGSY